MAVRRHAGTARRLVGAIRIATRPGSPGLAARVRALPRLLAATLRGDYSGTTVLRLLGLAAAAAYIVSPIDLLPEGFLGIFGLADDAIVLGWLATTFVTETEGFLAWEGGGPRPGDPVTVPGHVVR